MDCADCTISLDTLLAKRLKPTKCWHTTALVIADGLRWLHYLTRHFVSQAIETYEVLTHNRKGDWYWNELDTVSQAIDTYEVLTHNRKGDSQCWIRYLTRHFVSQAIDTYEVLTHNRKGDWYWNELDTVSRVIETYEVLIPVSWRLQGWLTLQWLDTVSRVIETYEVLTHNRKGDWYWNELDTVSQAIETYEVLIPVSWQRAFLTTARVIASAEYAISLDTLLAKRLIPTKCWYLFLDDCKGDWHWNGLTLLAEWLKPTKCWHTTARVIDIGMSLTLLAKRLKPTKCWYLFLDNAPFWQPQGW